MASYYRLRSAFAAAVLMAALFSASAPIAFADSFVLNVSGMVTGSTVNGAEVGAGNYQPSS